MESPIKNYPVASCSVIAQKGRYPNYRLLITPSIECNHDACMQARDLKHSATYQDMKWGET
jgi:hypothetical protein